MNAATTAATKIATGTLVAVAAAAEIAINKCMENQVRKENTKEAHLHAVMCWYMYKKTGVKSGTNGIGWVEIIAVVGELKQT